MPEENMKIVTLENVKGETVFPKTHVTAVEGLENSGNDEWKKADFLKINSTLSELDQRYLYYKEKKDCLEIKGRFYFSCAKEPTGTLIATIDFEDSFNLLYNQYFSVSLINNLKEFTFIAPSEINEGTTYSKLLIYKPYTLTKPTDVTFTKTNYIDIDVVLMKKGV